MTTPQTPLGSGFGHHSTAMEVIAGIDLTGKTALVTGGYSGIGTETVKALVSVGARVIVAGRRPQEADNSLADIRERIEVVQLDLSDPVSIDACAETVTELTDALDILINNAGIMAAPLSRDARGFEAQFATNHLGHFHLTARLWPLLAKAGNARVVALTSAAHKRFALNVEDPNFTTRDYEKWTAYGQAKSANALFALELDRLGASLGVRAFAVHPGAIVTNLGRHLSDTEKSAMNPSRTSDKVDAEPSDAKPQMGGLEWKNAEAGAATSVWAATSPLLDDKGGVYCNDSDIARLIEGPEEYNEFGVMPHVRDEAVAKRLWAISEEMTGVLFRP